MHVDLSGRRSGKTRRAVEWLKEKPKDRVMIVGNVTEKERIIRDYDLRSFFKGEIPVYTWFDVLQIHVLAGMERKELFIDNADFLLRELFLPHSVKKVSMCQESGGKGK